MARWEGGKRDVLLVPGLAEHAGRYAHVAAALGKAGFRASLIELRGHGESGGKRGHVDAWRRYVEDVWAAARALEDGFALVAHSMGGLVAVDALREALGQPVLGLAMSNPMIGLGFDPPRLKVKASRVLARVLPRVSIRNELDTSKLSRDPEIVRTYEADPLVFDTITPRWFVEAMDGMARAKEAAARITVPLLLMVGEGDKVCNPKAALMLGDRWAGPKVIHRYPGLYHELFNEPEKDKVLADLVAWLDRLPWEA